MNLLLRCLVAVLKFFKKLLLANPRLKTLLYDLHNRAEFGNLYEHEKMLADRVRVDTYQRAIRKHVHPGDVILDLGTGTGILAFFAAQQNPEKVFAVDHSEFIGVAEQIARHNNFANIEFVRSNSRNFDPGVKLDLVIHEQMGDYLFNENMLQNLLDLKKRLLKPGGRILPGGFELYLEPVHLVDGFNVPFIWENEISGVDFRFLKDYYETLEKFKPADYRQEWLDADAVKYLLCKPEPVLRFDLNEMDSENEIPHKLTISKHIEVPGVLDGFCLYFRAIFDDEIDFDTSPVNRATHWGNCCFRIESRKCAAGEDIEYTLTLADLLDIRTWSVSTPRFAGKRP